MVPRDWASVFGLRRSLVKSGLEVYVESVRAGEQPMMYTDIELVYRLRGNVKSASIAYAVELSTTKYCSSLKMMQKTANIRSRIEVLPVTAQLSSQRCVDESPFVRNLERPQYKFNY